MNSFSCLKLEGVTSADESMTNKTYIVRLNSYGLTTEIYKNGYLKTVKATSSHAAGLLITKTLSINMYQGGRDAMSDMNRELFLLYRTLSLKAEFSLPESDNT